jgi:SAM-dependent methyltransferase
MLTGWAIPQDLLAAAPQSPYFFDPSVFIAGADEAVNRAGDTVSDRVAREGLPTGGTVLDVGVGAGAASLRLGATTIIGVDPSPALLDAFVERAHRLGIAAVAVQGSWPGAAVETQVADVVVCHHVVYNVSDLAPFARALSEHAASRTVIELTACHPMAWLAPYWKALYDLDQPVRPTADDAIALLNDLGIAVHQRRWVRRIQMIGESGDQQLARIARRLCLRPDRLDELRGALSQQPPPAEREVVTVWWEPDERRT